jgi:hypothetical protein
LKKKAGIYGRAIENIREQSGLAASFQRELDTLDPPGLMHRLFGTKRWQAYEEKRAELVTRVRTAKGIAEKLQAIAKEHRRFQTEWDQTGYAEHRALANELNFDTPTELTLERRHCVEETYAYPSTSFGLE